MILIRFALISVIVYLVIRSFVRYSTGEGASRGMGEPGKTDNTSGKKVSKEIGEYIDYEEVDK